ncbi:predicted protein [Sclerotinia sclerotiorum 1980 UF-70]|uniref:Uncharacterized protein n=1 Tax=Sclerotinia sclerotiorum (strain ATCC 18683 / 1980 / Ss-1) TaxID=665079 RepID=A7E5L2_SCLS1|nr:predicted protein [Sclerotinia sclerotiorum 1980 UF-70]EDN91184.1 predicted protein [Sclerotinia sclerotiorum 1980 UF-70]
MASMLDPSLNTTPLVEYDYPPAPGTADPFMGTDTEPFYLIKHLIYPIGFRNLTRPFGIVIPKNYSGTAEVFEGIHPPQKKLFDHL